MALIDDVLDLISDIATCVYPVSETHCLVGFSMPHEVTLAGGRRERRRLEYELGLHKLTHAGYAVEHTHWEGDVNWHEVYLEDITNTQVNTDDPDEAHRILRGQAKKCRPGVWHHKDRQCYYCS